MKKFAKTEYFEAVKGVSFEIKKGERDVQLIVPVLDYSLPTKECCEAPGCVEDPCEMFSRIPFPANQFTPKGCDRKPEAQDTGGCGCGYHTTGNG